MLIAVHTDDYAVATNCHQLYTAFHAAYSAVYKCESKGVLSSFTGVSVLQESDCTTFSQAGVIKQFLKEQGLAECVGKLSPLVTNPELEFGHSLDESIPYRTFTGTANWYAQVTRPDISHAVTYHSQFNSCFTSSHF